MAIPYPSTFEYAVVTVDNQGKIRDRRDCQAVYRTEALGKGVNLELVMIPSGQCLMGSPEGEGNDSEYPQHLVTVESLWMSKYPVTQAQWEIVAGFAKIKHDLFPSPSKFKGVNRPVECVTWYDAEEFCQRLAQKTGQEYRLPSEAEWEYACRAGAITPFHFGETITTDLANYNGNYAYNSGPKGEYRQETTPVGSFKAANEFGLYDMHGNVGEWCLDPWHGNFESAPTDGGAWVTGGDDSFRLLRGGSWSFYPENCRSAFRDRRSPYDTDNSIGFRVVYATPPPL